MEVMNSDNDGVLLDDKFVTVVVILEGDISLRLLLLLLWLL